MSELIEFFATQGDAVFEQTLRHLALTFISVAIAVAIGVPLGIFIARKARTAGVVLSAVGVLQTIPSIALLGFMIPLFGIGIVPAIIALMLYALLPLVRNTYTGLRGVDGTVVEAARALGMTENQILAKVELPLAMPVILAGVRTATVITVGVATLAAYIGAGGLGEFIFGGIALNNTAMILGGAIPSAMLAIGLDLLLGLLQRASTQQRLQRIPTRQIKRILVVGGILLLAIPIGYYAFSAQIKTTQLRTGFTQEFMGRHDGYLGLQEVYGFDMPVVVMSDAVMYKALAENELDVISGYTTDGRIASYDLVALADDKNIFPPYYAAPLVRKQTLDEHPELRRVFNMLAGKINDSVMIALNYQVDFLKRSPEDVAKEFLESKGLLRSAQQGADRSEQQGTTSKQTSGTVVLGSKIFTEQYTLIYMYRMLVEAHTNLEVDLKTGLGGTQICFGALTNGAIDMYPEYTGTGLLVMLHAEGKLLDSLLSTKQRSTHESSVDSSKANDRVLKHVRAEFAHQYNLEWLEPLGFNNAYALMMRRQHAKELGIVTISDLVKHIAR